MQTHIPQMTWGCFAAQVGVEQPLWAVDFLRTLCSHFRVSEAAELPTEMTTLGQLLHTDPYIVFLHALAPEWRGECTGMPYQGNPRCIEEHYLLYMMVQQCTGTPKDLQRLANEAMEDRKRYAIVRKRVAARLHLAIPLEVKAKLWL